jgi:hypothetical protein
LTPPITYALFPTRPPLNCTLCFPHSFLIRSGSDDMEDIDVAGADW